MKDEHQGMVHYHLTDRTLTWAQVLRTVKCALGEMGDIQWPHYPMRGVSYAERVRVFACAYCTVSKYIVMTSLNKMSRIQQFCHIPCFNSVCEMREVTAPVSRCNIRSLCLRELLLLLLLYYLSMTVAPLFVFDDNTIAILLAPHWRLASR